MIRFIAAVVLMTGMLFATPLVLFCLVAMVPSQHKWFGLLCIIPIVLVGWLAILAGSGSFTRVQLDRTKLLDPCLILTSFIACIPIRKRTVHLLDYKATWTDYQYRAGRRTAREIYLLYLGGEYVNDKPLICIYHGSSNARMGELCDLLAEVANLEVKRR